MSVLSLGELTILFYVILFSLFKKKKTLSFGLACFTPANDETTIELNYGFWETMNNLIVCVLDLFVGFTLLMISLHC